MTLIVPKPAMSGGEPGKIDAIPVNPVAGSIDRHVDAAATTEKQG